MSLYSHCFLYMTYEDIWQKVKRMRQRDRKQLAYEIHELFYFLTYTILDFCIQKIV